MSVRNLFERLERNNRRLARGGLDGRTEQAQRLPERPRAEKDRPASGAYTALLPWGYAGDASTKNGWHSIHLDQAAADAETEPYLHFGLAPLENNAIGIGAILDGTSRWEQYVDDDEFRLYALSQGSASTLGAWLVVNGASDSVGLLFQGPESQTLDITLDSTQGYFDMFTAAGNQAFLTVQDDGDTFLNLLCAGTGQSWLQMNESAADPPAPSANRMRLFIKDNGAGKTGLYARFATGAVQGPIVLQP